jgi:hypothetical protein
VPQEDGLKKLLKKFPQIVIIVLKFFIKKIILKKIKED